MSSRYIRGSSILAALLLVGVLAVVSFGVQAVSGFPQAQVAAGTLAVNTISSPTISLLQSAPIGGTPTSFKNTAPTSCTDAINKAKGKISDPESESVDQGKSGILDNCFGAYLKPGKKPSSNAADYSCVGRSGTAVVTTKSVTVTTHADQSITLKDASKGICKINVCQGAVSAASCGEAKAFAGGVNSGGVGVEGKMPNLTAGVEKSEPVPYQGGATGSEAVSNAFDINAFRSGNAEADLAAAESQVKTAQDNLNNIMGQCWGSAPAGTDCSVDSSEEQIKQNKEALEKARQDLANLKELQKAEQASIKPSGSCPLGQLWDAGTCYKYNPNDGSRTKVGPEQPAAQVPIPQPRPQAPFTPGPEDKSASAAGGLSGLMQSILGGLAKALGGGASGGSGAPCPSDPAAYAQAQQQYQQQMQAYNTQLQQYNYQQTINQLNGLPQPVPPVAPQPCQQTPTSNTCPAAPVQPVCPAGSTAKAITGQSSTGAQCTTGWQCVADAQPTAQISCQPQLADVGMSVAISFTCGNSTGSTGQGFDSANLTSGSSTPTISAPPDNARTANFGINCTKGTLAAAKQCSIEINRPSIVLLANPQTVALNASSTVGWVTAGMSTCVISSPDLPDFTAENATNTSVNGGVITPNLSTTTTMLLHCVTLAGGVRDATTTIEIAE